MQQQMCRGFELICSLVRLRRWEPAAAHLHDENSEVAADEQRGVALRDAR